MSGNLEYTPPESHTNVQRMLRQSWKQDITSEKLASLTKFCWTLLSVILLLEDQAEKDYVNSLNSNDVMMLVRSNVFPVSTGSALSYRHLHE